MAKLTTAIRKSHRAIAFTVMGETVTYTQTSDSVSLTTGTVTESDTDTSVTALIGGLDQRAIRESAGRYQVGDVRFRIAASDLPATPPRQTDEITYDSTTYKVVDHELSSDQNYYDVVGRRV